MKNAGLAGAIALCGIGLIMIGLGNFVSTPTAMAAAPAVAQDKGEPTIVWYDAILLESASPSYHDHFVLRAWSDGRIEARVQRVTYTFSGDTCLIGDVGACSGWKVLSSTTEGLNAAADITFDEVVDGQDLATLLGSWGAAPRNPMPPSDCPLGLLN